MNDLMLWMGVLVGEIVLVIFILLFVSWLRNAAARRNDHKAMAKLITQVRKNKAERSKVIEQFLEQKMGLSGEALKSNQIQLLREEMRLLQRFSNVYMQRDSATAAQFYMSVEAMIEPYHQLTGDAVGAQVGSNDESNELSFLRSENTRLSEELSVTMDTMSRMLNEYSTMFSNDSDEEAEVTPTDMVLPEEAELATKDESGVEDRELSELDEVELDISEENDDEDEDNVEITIDESIAEAEGVSDGLSEADVVEEVELAVDETADSMDIDTLLDEVNTDEVKLAVDEVAADNIESLLDSAMANDEDLFDSDEVVDLDDKKKDSDDSVVI